MHTMIFHKALRKENEALLLTVRALSDENLHLVARIAQLEIILEKSDRALSRAPKQANPTRTVAKKPVAKKTTPTKPAAKKAVKKV